jgi:nucleosome assembly protein 1-like 1
MNFKPIFNLAYTNTFEPNDYLENEKLTKIYHMADENILEKAEGTEIEWKGDCNPTKKEVKKKQKNKKTGETRTVKKKEDQDSFFQFFKSQAMPTPDKLESMKKDDLEELTNKLDEDFDLGNDIFNEIIPEALELYLGVVDDGYSDINSDSESSDQDNDNPDHPGSGLEGVTNV